MLAIYYEEIVSEKILKFYTVAADMLIKFRESYIRQALIKCKHVCCPSIFSNLSTFSFLQHPQGYINKSGFTTLVCVCVCVCLRACVRVCVRACACYIAFISHKIIFPNFNDH